MMTPEEYVLRHQRPLRDEALSEARLTRSRRVGMVRVTHGGIPFGDPAGDTYLLTAPIHGAPYVECDFAGFSLRRRTYPGDFIVQHLKNGGRLYIWQTHALMFLKRRRWGKLIESIRQIIRNEVFWFAFFAVFSSASEAAGCARFAPESPQKYFLIDRILTILPTAKICPPEKRLLISSIFLLKNNLLSVHFAN